jgi:hypothetical protein
MIAIDPLLWKRSTNVNWPTPKRLKKKQGIESSQSGIGSKLAYYGAALPNGPIFASCNIRA